MVGAIHDARQVVIAGAAHIANVEQPDAFTEAMLGHLRGAGEDAR